MKCFQKLCQRTKSICSSGYCNVCDSVINDMTKKHQEASKKKSNFEKVDIDVKRMITIHTQLINGSPIDPDTVNALLLGGIVNILSQSEAFEDAENRIKALES